jgi:hypothetical protein
MKVYKGVDVQIHISLTLALVGGDSSYLYDVLIFSVCWLLVILLEGGQRKWTVALRHKSLGCAFVNGWYHMSMYVQVYI